MNRQIFVRILAVSGAVMLVCVGAAFALAQGKPPMKEPAEAVSLSEANQSGSTDLSRFKELIGGLRDAKTDTEREAAERELRNLLDRHFDEDIQRREQELAALENRVGKLRDLLVKRKEAKERILDLQSRVLINQAEGLGVFEGDLTNLLNSPAGSTASGRGFRQSRSDLINYLQSLRSNTTATGRSIVSDTQKWLDAEQGWNGDSRHNEGQGPAAQKQEDLQQLMRQLMLGTRLYEADHENCLPETLEEAEKAVGGTNLLEQILAPGNAECLIYIWAPHRVNELQPLRPAVIAPTGNGCQIGRYDGSAWIMPKSAATLLAEEFEQLAKAQPGVTAELSLPSDIVGPDERALIETLKNAGISITRTEKLPVSKRIRIRLSVPDAAQK